MAYSDLTPAHILRWTAGEWFGEEALLQRPFSGVSTDSRTAQPGDLFVALAGDRFDGHDFVLPRAAAGGSISMVSARWYANHAGEAAAANLIVVPETLHSFQEAAAAYRATFSIPAIAVTGSVGKTTTKEAIFSVLSRRFRVLRNAKSFNNHIGVPLTLFGLRDEHQILLAELGTNHFGELDRLGALVRPDMAMITNIGYAHLEFFQDLAGVARAKFEIFNHCRPDGTAFFNADDAILRGHRYPLAHTRSFGVDHPADLNAEVLGCDDRARYTLRILGRDVTLPVSGRHNIDNALAAAAVGLEFGLALEEILTGVAELPVVDKRMAMISHGGMLLMNDTYNANPNSCSAALRTLADISVQGSGRRIAVLGDMLELGGYSTQEHRKLADLAAGCGLDQLFLFGRETQATLERAGELGLPARHFSDKEGLAEALTECLQPGNVILFKGSRGMQMETLVEGVQHHLATNSK
jgi:UDP-N-acetylmuramoyl-tripeptide--D-alanyl-D-alanine ligase